MPGPAGPDNVMIEDARIVFRNFEGKEGPYNRAGDRNFAIFLDDATAEQMVADGWNVKHMKPLEDEDVGISPQAYIQVAVSYKGRPPKIAMITSRGRTFLGESEVEMLDWVEIKTADVILNPYVWAVGDKTGIKAYLQTLYITIVEDPLDLKYAEMEEREKEEAQADV